MFVITQISPQVKRAGFYNIYVNDKYELSLSELDLISSGLKTNQTIDEKKLEELKNTQARSKSYNFAIRYLALRPRSTHEVNQYLTFRKGFSSEDANYTIARLTDEGYLNDKQFSEMWIRNRMLLSPKSDKVLRLELIKKGIPNDIIQEAISNLDEHDKISSIKSLIEKKQRQTKYQDKQKLTEYLSRQGYNYGLIKQALEELALL
jgi:regulatory protein